jgi:class 3 adenylate cyclase/DNA-binding Lrp family transcriptional regulator
MANGPWETLEQDRLYQFCFLRVDVVGSTAIAKESPTDEIRKTLSDLFSHILNCVTSRGGQQWHRAGEGALYAFYDEKTSLMADRATSAAIAIIRELDAFNNTSNRLRPLRMRVAAHLGLVPYQADKGSIISDDINFVTKLEEATTPDSIAISEQVYKELGPGLRNLFRSTRIFQDHRIWTPGITRTGDAYVLLEVDPAASSMVAQRIVEMNGSNAQYAAAVWGMWDVIARVTLNQYNELLLSIDRLRGEIKRIRRTETWCIRNDQPHYENERVAQHLAFVMLRINPAQASAEFILAELCNAAEEDGIQIRHVAGVLGPYDIVATVHYEDDAALRNLVMERFQQRSGVQHTLTIPSIRGMVYPKARA